VKRAWFLPALLVADLAFFRRPLPYDRWLRFIWWAAAIAIVTGMLTPGMFVMLGYPVAALAILVLAFARRAEVA
jgi:hypothetical protein